MISIALKYYVLIYFHILTCFSLYMLDTKPNRSPSAMVKINKKIKFIGDLRRTLVQQAMEMSRTKVTARHTYISAILFLANSPALLLNAKTEISPKVINNCIIRIE